MVNFKTSSGVTISIPGKLTDKGVQKAIREIRLNELKEAMKSANKPVKAATAKEQRRGGVSKKRGGVRKR
jgi:hypothetical protein|tara:strand:- start:182 stop:391 length:210 start_codon:yes stop_codon:yes gene_type:complete